MSNKPDLEILPNKIIARAGHANAVYFKASRRIVSIGDQACFDDIDRALSKLADALAQYNMAAPNDRLIR